jgi:hypothetical protein
MLTKVPVKAMAAIVVLSACAHVERSNAGEADVCLAAQIGDWMPPSELTQRQQPPDVFELLEEMGTGMFERGRTIVRPAIEGYGTPSAYWSEPSPDSLIVTWTNGFEGIRLRLTREGEIWTGTANPITDVVVVGRPTPTASVVVEPVACT